MILFAFWCFCISIEELIDVSLMGDKHIEFSAGESYSVGFDNPYGLFIPRIYENCMIQFMAQNPKTDDMINDSITFTDNEIAATLFFAKWKGKVTITASQQEKLSFSWITFPSNCDYFYFDNNFFSDINLSVANGSLCYHNSAELPAIYEIDYPDDFHNFENVSLDIFDETGKINSIHGNEKFKFVFNKTTVIQLNNKNNDIFTLNLKVKSNAQSNQYPNPFKGFLQNDIPSFLFLKNLPTKKQKSLSVTFSVIGIASVCVIMFIIIVIIYRRRGEKINAFIENDEFDEQNICLSRDNSSTEKAPGDDDVNLHFEDIIFRDQLRNRYIEEAEGYPDNHYQPPKEGIDAPTANELNNTLDDPNYLP
ncbi:hypothetical protein TRFO_12745 [Tritrichomonas foetus]|uniref:Transmembrane protein n=1 Tax=Tritrichomonas foetus TaxID=1144522 RepID=A0A1J4L0K6_9EUKA|nr:hypothetical protein TRFO_12745 [Tritrichomonas foetus]|eukprot:OHT17039.1 hypothetical protein TRFO_12745 [Tritrichomonas foetus]